MTRHVPVMSLNPAVDAREEARAPRPCHAVGAIRLPCQILRDNHPRGYDAAAQDDNCQTDDSRERELLFPQAVQLEHGIVGEEEPAEDPVAADYRGDSEQHCGGQHLGMSAEKSVSTLIVQQGRGVQIEASEIEKGENWLSEGC